MQACVASVLPAVRPGQLFINTSTCLPDTDRQAAAQLAGRAAAWVDAPLTWRPKGFVFMVGGEAASYRLAEPILDLIGGRHRHMGPPGSGQLCKLMQQTLVAYQNAVRAEAAAFCRRAGFDPAWLRDYLGFDFPQRLLDEEPGTKNTLGMMYKDLGYYLQEAHDRRAAVLLAAVVHEAFKTTLNAADGPWDHDAIHAFWRLQHEPWPPTADAPAAPEAKEADA